MHVAIYNDGVPMHFLSRLTELGSELDLIPLAHFLELYRHSPILTVNIYAYCVCILHSHLPNADLPIEYGVLCMNT
jgi:hypothetical protein